MSEDQSLQPPKRERTAAQIAAFEKARAVREANIYKKLRAAEKEDKARDKPAPDAVPAPEPPPPPETLPAKPDGVDPFQEVVEWDPDQFTTHVDYTKAEIDSLKQQLEMLKADQSLLTQCFSEHHVKTHNSLSFV